MNMSAVRSFVFYDKQTGFELFVKRSRGPDFTFDCDDFFSVQKDGPAETVQGESTRIQFLRNKIKAAVWLRATFALIRDGVEQDFSSQSLHQIPIQAEHQQKFKALMDDERRILFDRISSNQKRFEAAILSAKDEEELSNEILLMRNNVVIGIYSPIERESKKIRGVY